MGRYRFPTETTADPAALATARAYTLPTARKTDATKVEWHTDRFGLISMLAECNRLQPVTRDDDPEWHGTRCDGEALTLAINGWADPVEDIVKQARSLTVKPMRSLIPKVMYLDEPGDDVDVSRYLDGEDDCYSTCTPSSIDARGRGAVRIVIEPCVSAGIGTEAIVQRGAIVLAIMWALERAGVRTALAYQSHISAGAFSSSDIDVTIRADIKRFRDPIDVRGLAFWLAHPAASRVVCFCGCYLALPVCGRTFSRNGMVGWGHRQPVPADSVECPELHTSRMATVEQWIATVAKKAGIEWKR